MSPLRAFTAFALLGILTITSSTQAQNVLSIPDTGWRLWIDREAAWENDTIFLPQDVNLRALPVNAPTGGWETLDKAPAIIVTLPSTVEEHYWGSFGLRPYTGEYFYETQDTAVRNGNYLGVSWWWRDIDVPKRFEGKKMLLFIRGARLRAEVYLNRSLVGYNIITESSITCDVTDAVRPGKKNRLAVRITNPGGRLDWLDTELLAWGKTEQRFHKSHGFGGLDRGLRLSAHDPVYLRDVWVLNKPEVKTIAAYSLVSNKSAGAAWAKVLFEILDPNRGEKSHVKVERELELPPSAEIEVHADLEFRDALLWSNETPKLYRLRTTVLSHPTKQAVQTGWRDSRDVAFGFRWFDADGIGTNAVLRFNGSRIRLTSAISWGFGG